MKHHLPEKVKYLYHQTVAAPVSFTADEPPSANSSQANPFVIVKYITTSIRAAINSCNYEVSEVGSKCWIPQSLHVRRNFPARQDVAANKLLFVDGSNGIAKADGRRRKGRGGFGAQSSILLIEWLLEKIWPNPLISTLPWTQYEARSTACSWLHGSLPSMTSAFSCR